MRRVLGISAFYHDSAAALIEGGEVRAAVQEERFSRQKHDASFPLEAVRYCLSQATGPLDAVAYYEKPILKFERILRTAFAVAPAGFKAFGAAIPVWMKQKLWIPIQIENAFAQLGTTVPGEVLFATHHQAHAASAFHPSPFARAAILTLDGVGEWTTTAMGRGEGNAVELLSEIRFPHSLGLLYSAFTYFCGFRVNSGEYKLMGLAPYGESNYVQTILDHLIDLHEDGSFHLNLEYFGYLHGERMTNDRFAALFGGPRREPEAPVTQRECDLARSIQAVTEEAVLRIARTLHQKTGETNLCLAGGVALNCVANGRLLREGPFAKLWIQPAAGDAGGALGAALAVYHEHFGESRQADGHTDRMGGSLLGPAYDRAAIAAALSELGLEVLPLEPDALRERIVARLIEGKVVGLFQGRAEFGPRALGNRSILGDPRNAGMQRTLNLKIKFRESFRPFAPIVPLEDVSTYFDLDVASPYMLLTAPVAAAHRRETSGGAATLGERLQQVRSALPAVTHVDNSARIQTVDAATHPDLHALLKAFGARTGYPVLVNTSFNVRGEPPVCHPRDALAGFLETEMDCLALGPYFLEKSDLPASLRTPRPRRAFQPD